MLIASFIQGDSPYLLGIQLLAAVVLIVWTAASSFFILKLIDLTIGLRVSLQHEILGADIIEHGVGQVEYIKKSNILKFNGMILQINNLTTEQLEQITNHVFQKETIIEPLLAKQLNLLQIKPLEEVSLRPKTVADSVDSARPATEDSSIERAEGNGSLNGILVDSMKCEKTKKNTLSETENKEKNGNMLGETSYVDQCGTDSGVNNPAFVSSEEMNIPNTNNSKHRNSGCDISSNTSNTCDNG